MSTRPNIVLILTDQQSATMMSCTGNPWLQTPNMDSLAADGVRFDRAYCANPVCIASRYSIFTGNLPSHIGLIDNRIDHISPPTEDQRQNALGWLLRNAGYQTLYAGKQHFPRFTADDIGFETISTDERYKLGHDCANFIRQPHTNPYFLVASFINPHDICYMAIRDFAETEGEKRLIANGRDEIPTLDAALQRPPGISDEEFFQHHCPPLPPNYEPQENEPEAIRQFLHKSPFKEKARRFWSDNRWREHRYAYARLTELVDRQIAPLLNALRDTGQGQHTLILFTSDHGDNDASHRMEHKSMFYDNACRIPFIIRPPGGTTARVDTTHLVSNGLDILPTLCDYAGAKPPPTANGRSLRPLLEGPTHAPWRQYLPLESTVGRAIFSQRYKYCVYAQTQDPERLTDLQEDPLEMKDATRNPEHAAALNEHRAEFNRTFAPIAANSKPSSAPARP